MLVLRERFQLCILIRINVEIKLNKRRKSFVHEVFEVSDMTVNKNKSTGKNCSTFLGCQKIRQFIVK